ncbi:MAG: hypothetical protein PWP27_211 [Clostridiales bacterium]|nr:hypothetical protein [Clostridiales bacterium]
MLNNVTAKVFNFDAKERQKQKYKEDIIAFVFREFERRRTEKLPLELNWRLLINFIQGNQHVHINAYSNDIENNESYYWWEEREVFNQLRPILQTRLAKLNKLAVTLKVRPASGDSDDISSAKVSSKILEGVEKQEKLHKKQKEANTWSEKTGTAIWKTVWNPQKGRIIGQVIEENSEIDEIEQSILEEFEIREAADNGYRTIRNIFEGDVDINVYSPFEIYPESIFKPIHYNRSIQHARVFHEDELFENWGVTEKGEKLNVFSLKKSTGSGGLGQKGIGYTIGSAVHEHSVLVIEHWELPSKRYPRGRLIIASKNNLLYYGPLPYGMTEEGKYELPFDVQKCIINEYFFGETVFEDLLPVQRRYNSIRNRIKEYLNRAAIGQMTYEEGAIDEDMLEEDGLAPGQMIPRRQGSQKPEYLQYPALPATFHNEDATIEHMFNVLSGVSEAAKSSTPPTGVGSGIMLSLLKEDDDTRIALTGDDIQQARISIGIKVLRLYKQFADYPRMIRTVGKNNTIEVTAWDKNDITSFDVYIETSSMLSETPAQRRQMVFDLLQAGLFNDPDTGRITKEGRAKIFEMIELGDWETFDDEDNLHTQKALRENREMIQGNMMPIREFDDDIMHIHKHNSYRLTSDYDDLLRQNPEIDEIFEQHVMMHVMSLQQKVGAAQAPGDEVRADGMPPQ